MGLRVTRPRNRAVAGGPGRRSGSVAVLGNQLPKTMHFDIDAQKSTTENGVTDTASMTFHGTLTFSRVS